MDGQRTLESFGYKQELRRSVATVDLLVYGLVFMVPIAPWAIFGTVCCLPRPRELLSARL